MKFQSLVDRAVLNSDKDVLRRLMTTEPELPELDKLRNELLKNEILRSVRRREKSVYGIVIADHSRDSSSNRNVIPVDIFSRTGVVLRVAGGRETRQHVVDHVKNNFNDELELAREIV